jgi:hypothetical protein
MGERRGPLSASTPMVRAAGSGHSRGMSEDPWPTAPWAPEADADERRRRRPDLQMIVAGLALLAAAVLLILAF